MDSRLRRPHSIELHPYDIRRKWFVCMVYQHPPYAISYCHSSSNTWKRGSVGVGQLRGRLTQLPTRQTHDSCDRFPAPPTPTTTLPVPAKSWEADRRRHCCCGLLWSSRSLEFDMSESGLSNVSVFGRGLKWF